MADGDQLFFFLNGLTNDCRRYVELHHPCKLQDALDYCLNFEQVHTNSQGQIPMELNFLVDVNFEIAMHSDVQIFNLQEIHFVQILITISEIE